MKSKVLLVPFIFMFVFSSCVKDEVDDMLIEDEELPLVNAYISPSLSGCCDNVKKEITKATFVAWKPESSTINDAWTLNLHDDSRYPNDDNGGDMVGTGRFLIIQGTFQSLKSSALGVIEGTYKVDTENSNTISTIYYLVEAGTPFLHNTPTVHIVTSRGNPIFLDAKRISDDIYEFSLYFMEPINGSPKKTTLAHYKGKVDYFLY